MLGFSVKTRIQYDARELNSNVAAFEGDLPLFRFPKRVSCFEETGLRAPATLHEFQKAAHCPALPTFGCDDCVNNRIRLLPILKNLDEIPALESVADHEVRPVQEDAGTIERDADKADST